MVGDESGLRPLEEFVEEQESDEIQDDARSEVLTKSRTARSGRKRRAYYVNEEGITAMGKPRVSKRVRYLSDDEIRRERGLMSKPYDNVLKNVFWTLKEEKRPMSCKELGAAVKKKPADVASRLIKVFRRLGKDRTAAGEPTWIDRYQEGNWFMYFLTPEGLEAEVDDLYKAYSQHPRDHKKAKAPESIRYSQRVRKFIRTEVQKMGDDLREALTNQLRVEFQNLPQATNDGKPTVALQKFVRAEISGAISSASETILNEVAKTIGGGPGGIVKLVETVVAETLGPAEAPEPHQPTLPGLGQPTGAQLDINVRFGIAR